MKTIIEPFRIKVVEPIRMTTATERKAYLRAADYNPFRLKSDEVLIDLLTDSGTGAMSTEQWAGIMRGDETYAGARSYYRFRESVGGLFGHEHIIPTHQGRAAERLLCSAVVKNGDVIPGNTHFDTTRANIEMSDAIALDIPIPEARDPDDMHPFKGNIDLDALESCLKEHGKERVPFVLITVTNNSGGGQPVSMENLRATRRICDEHGVPLFLDAARFAENACFIKRREKGFADHTARAIAEEMFSLSDGAMMSMKKDALANIGGVLTMNDNAWALKARQLLVVTEGFPSYGGLAGRDLEALAIGLNEILEEDYLHYRIESTRYVGRELHEAGVPLLKPIGGHADYLNGRKFCSHLTDEQLPGWSLSAALYEAIGVRACEIGNVMFGRPNDDGSWEWPGLDLVRLAIPRRVYTQSHMDYVVEGIIELFGRRHEIPGMRFTERPDVLPHFTARFEPVPVAAPVS